MKKIAVFASGFGSNFQAIIEAVKQQTLNAEIALLVSDNPSSKAVERASAAGIDAFTFCAKDYAGKAAYEQAVLDELRKRQVDYIVSNVTTPALVSSNLSRTTDPPKTSSTRPMP